MQTETVMLPEEQEPAAAARPQFENRATVAVAAVVVLAFVLEVVLSASTLTGLLSPSVPALVSLGGITRALVLTEGEWWRLIAGPLLHADLMHLVMNLVVLLFAGTIVEKRLGAARWLVVYGVGATCGALASTFANRENVVSVGASGAVMALLATMFMLSFGEQQQEARSAMMVNSLRFLVPSLLPMATRGTAVDLAAHLGGAVAGIALGFVFNHEPSSRPLSGLAQVLAGLCLSVTTLGAALTLREVPGLYVATEQATAAELSPWLERACDARSRRACVTLGRALATGKELPADAARAVTLLRRPCLEFGDSQACFSLGYAASQLVKPDRKTAIDAYERACDAKDNAACFNLALLLRDERQVEAGRVASLFERGCPEVARACESAASELTNEPERALPLARKGCEAKEAYACWLAGKWLEKSAPDQARSMHDKACELGNAFGCNSSAVYWLNGVGGAKDPAKAAALFARACELKDPQSCTNYALTLMKGEGVKADKKRAAELFASACEGGNSQGCENVVEGLKRPELPPRRALLEQACEAGAGAACRLMGWFAYEGIGQSVDKKAADDRFAKACELGDGTGCYWHGVDLQDGDGVEKDADEAREVLERSCRLGVEQACKHATQRQP